MERKQLTVKILLSQREAAQSLSLCEKTLRSLTAPAGPIPVVKVGRACRYRPADLSEWAEKALIHPGSGA